MHIEIPCFHRGRGWIHRLATVLLLLGGFTQTAQAVDASLVLDASTGTVLSENHADALNHPASLTKMMTIYLTFRALRDGRITLDQKLPVSQHAANMAPTKLGLRAGQTISVRNCLLGMITKSANDAATVMAEELGGTEAHFVEAMNAQGLLLGMSHTRFASASGLPHPDDSTTARDISRLALALYRDFPDRAPMFSTREFTFRGRTVRGHNHLMERYPGMDGLKTGYTAAAGFNLASTAMRDGHRLFGVVLHGDSARARDNLMGQLLDEGFEQSQASPALIAAVGKPAHRSVLAALSPIGIAEAEAVPAARFHRKAVRHVAGKRAKVTTRVASATHSKRHRKTTSALASVTTRSSRCGKGDSALHACAIRVHAHKVRQPAKLAHRDVKPRKIRKADQHD
ncbi:MAG: D-alanyl-D-alanine carboxypeptidase family protein [Rhodanobacter sp.]